MEISKLEIGKFYWIKSKDICFGVKEITIGEFLGESNFHKNMFLINTIGRDVSEDLDDWEILREAL